MNKQTNNLQEWHAIEMREDANEESFERESESWRLLADQIAPRIDRLSSLVDSLHAAPYYVWLKDRAHACDAASELRVKVEALQWMFRIAKHLNGYARDMVMSTVCRSVDDMEVAIEAQLRANAVRPAA